MKHTAKDSKPNYLMAHFVNRFKWTELLFINTVQEFVTAVVDDVQHMEMETTPPSFFHWLISNRFSRLIRNLFLGWGMDFRFSSLAQTRKGRYKEESQRYLESMEVFCHTELTTTLETERRGTSIWHVVPPIVSFEILQVGGEAICRAGWYFSLMQIHQCLKQLSAFR